MSAESTNQHKRTPAQQAFDDARSPETYPRPEFIEQQRALLSASLERAVFARRTLDERRIELINNLVKRNLAEGVFTMEAWQHEPPDFERDLDFNSGNIWQRQHRTVATLGGIAKELQVYLDRIYADTPFSVRMRKTQQRNGVPVYLLHAMWPRPHPDAVGGGRCVAAVAGRGVGGWRTAHAARLTRWEIVEFKAAPKAAAKRRRVETDSLDVATIDVAQTTTSAGNE